jgi:DNA invertase Pin-like site-specific DNA recombinase
MQPPRSTLFKIPEIFARNETMSLFENEKRQRRPAFGYTRTSTATNVGEGKDSVTRQRLAINKYAARAGYKIVEWFDDPAVKGADPVTERKDFRRLLDAIAANGCRTVIVEDPSRFARDLIVQLTGHDYLKRLDVVLIAANAPDHFLEDTPTAKLIRQVLGAVAEFEKTSLVAKLKGARDRKKTETGKCEGRKSTLEWNPAAVTAAQRLRSENLRMSLRKIAAELEHQGHINQRGQRFSAGGVKAMLAAKL